MGSNAMNNINRTDFDPMADRELHDKGPWNTSRDGRGIESDDFTHDVVLRVMGDFYNDEQRVAYSKNLAEKLNHYDSVESQVKTLTELVDSLQHNTPHLGDLIYRASDLKVSGREDSVTLTAVKSIPAYKDMRGEFEKRMTRRLGYKFPDAYSIPSVLNEYCNWQEAWMASEQNSQQRIIELQEENKRLTDTYIKSLQDTVRAQNVKPIPSSWCPHGVSSMSYCNKCGV